MNIKKDILALFFAVLLLSSSALPNTIQAETKESCVNKTCLPLSLVRGATTIPLASSALFTYLLFDVYTLALYVEPTAKDVLGDMPRSLLFHYHREIMSKDMIEGAKKNLEQNPTVKIDDYTSELDQLNSWYVDVKEGDRYELNYLPGVGTSLYLNNKLLGTVKSESPERAANFARDYFGIWLSKYPLSEGLRENILQGIKQAAD